MSGFNSISVAIGAGLIVAASASGAIVAMDQVFGPAGADPLILTDGQWIQGFQGINGPGDFGISASATAIWIKERWGGAPGSVVDLDTFVQPDPNTDAIFPIAINKKVTNESNIVWDAFEIRLIPTTGTLSNVQAIPNAHFADLTITQDGDDFIIYFEKGIGFGGLIGKDITFQFFFDYEGDIFEGINFRIFQTAIPTPGTMGLLALAGLAATRRRR